MTARLVGSLVSESPAGMDKTSSGARSGIA